LVPSALGWFHLRHLSHHGVEERGVLTLVNVGYIGHREVTIHMLGDVKQRNESQVASDHLTLGTGDGSRAQAETKYCCYNQNGDQKSEDNTFIAIHAAFSP